MREKIVIHVLSSFFNIPFLLGYASINHPRVSIPLLSIGVLGCVALIYFIPPLWLGISLGMLAVLGASCWVLPIMAVLFPIEVEESEVGEGGPWYLPLGLAFFLSLVATGCCLFFIPSFSLSIGMAFVCFILAFPLSGLVTWGLESWARAWTDSNYHYHKHMRSVIPFAHRFYWQKRLSHFISQHLLRE